MPEDNIKLVWVLVLVLGLDGFRDRNAAQMNQIGSLSECHVKQVNVSKRKQKQQQNGTN